jgi:hypothetical protein
VKREKRFNMYYVCILTRPEIFITALSRRTEKMKERDRTYPPVMRELPRPVWERQTADRGTHTNTQNTPPTVPGPAGTTVPEKHSKKSNIINTHKHDNTDKNNIQQMHLTKNKPGFLTHS